MAVTYNTTTADFLRNHAAVTLKDAAEKTIKETVEAFEKTIRQKVYDEVSKLAIRYVEALYENSDPLNGKTLHIVVDDRREGK